jgi:uncharacterized protein (DUF1697 family)
MPRYAAFLRGVSPMNCKMPELKRCLEKAGFTDVVTILSSGNVVFDARTSDPSKLERAIEAAMEKHLGRVFQTQVRSVEDLQRLLDEDPFRKLKMNPAAKKVVTFLPEVPYPAPRLPIERDGATLLALQGRELFSAYLKNPKGPVFMVLIESTFGKNVTTRTWETIRKVAAK